MKIKDELKLRGWKISGIFYESEHSSVLIRVTQEKMNEMTEFQSRYCNVYGSTVQLYGPSTTKEKTWELYNTGNYAEYSELEPVIKETEKIIHDRRGQINSTKFGF